MHRLHALLLIAISALVPWTFGCGSGDGTPGATGTPPTISTTLSPSAIFERLFEMAFQVTATDPDGDPVTLSLVNAPPGAIFARVAGVGTATGTFRWTPIVLDSFDPRLIFRASDTNGNVTFFSVYPQINTGFRGGRPFVCCDVTGDGVMDVVARASAADIGVADAGALYVFAGATTPSGSPIATLRVPAPAVGAMLAGPPFQDTFECCDVNGDGIDDVVASAPRADTAATDAGAVYVFFGGSGIAGLVSPGATLTVPGASADDELGSGGLRCCDVTGDGTRDVVVWSDVVDLGVTDAGAVYVWTGGPGLTGAQPPTATLRRAAPVANDRLTSSGLFCCDVTGDGRRDILAVSSSIDQPGLIDAGAVLVWAGGAGLTGTPAPVATLAGTSANDQIGNQSIRCCDVTASGVLDIVAGSQSIDFPGAIDAGGVLVWAGGPGLGGTPPPTATLRRATPAANDVMGLFRCCEVTGDSRLDILVYNEFCDTTVADAGELNVWAGGTLSGTPAPTATLRIPTPTAGDRLSETIACCDVTGDSINDLILTARLYDGTVVDEGAVFVWAGGPGLTGIATPRARLTRAGALTGDHLGGFDRLICCDVTGDTVPDVVVGTKDVDAGSTQNTGGAYVYAGGAGLTGNIDTPTASLTRPAAIANDELTGDGVLMCCDVTGDGIADVLASSEDIDISGTAQAGAILLWHGGVGLTGAPTPTATLQAPTLVLDDRVGQFVYCCDVDADGVLDVLTPAPLKDLAAVGNAGAMYWWRGTAALTGTPLPVQLRRAIPVANDFFSDFGTAPVCCDITGDGIADLLTSTAQGDVGGVTDTGLLAWWRGGSAPTAEANELVVPGAVAGDGLGN